MSVKSVTSAIRIDAHHHFWAYTPEEYGWIDESMARIRRDFLPAHLAPELRACGIDAVVSVQARQTLERKSLASGAGFATRLHPRCRRLGFFSCSRNQRHSRIAHGARAIEGGSSCLARRSR